MNSLSYSIHGLNQLTQDNTETVTDPVIPCNCSVGEFDRMVKNTQQLFSIKAKIIRLNAIHNSEDDTPTQEGEDTYLFKSALSDIEQLIDTIDDL